MNNNQRNQKQLNNEQERPSAKPKKVRKRRKPRNPLLDVLLFIFKWVFIFACFAGATVLGLIVGFSVIGEGEASEVLNLDLWKHLYELAFGS
jgi:hypothetical protein